MDNTKKNVDAAIEQVEGTAKLNTEQVKKLNANIHIKKYFYIISGVLFLASLDLQANPVSIFYSFAQYWVLLALPYLGIRDRLINRSGSGDSGE